MKTVLRNTITLAVTMFALVATAYGQSYLEDPKWGNSPEEREANALEYNFFNDMYNAQNYDQAIEHLENLIQRVPKATPNIYVNGINIYKNKVARATSVAEKNQFIDKIFYLYDLRIENFGDDPNRGRPYILQNMAIDYLTYKPMDRDGLRDIFSEAIKANGTAIDPSFINVYFKELTDDYKADEIEADDYLSIYDELEEIMLALSGEEAEDAMKTFEALFITSGAANCDNLEAMFGKRFRDNPEDLDMLAKAVGLLTRGNCKGDLYMEIAEKYYQLDPSSNTALILAAGYEERKEFSKAIRYLEAAAASETDPELKVNLYIRMASSELGAGNGSGAASHARQALAINPESGLAYYVLGQAYAVGANGCSGFNRQAAFWLVYDTLATAKRLMGSDANQVGNIDAQMANYRAGFPSREECFFRGLNEGEGYTVSCGWVSGRTTVREGR